uniref:Uncharacterized protein n=1 Tax=Latimeria chalumnae TaxID=7897 RepID=H3A4E2_LATCH
CLNMSLLKLSLFLAVAMFTPGSSRVLDNTDRMDCRQFFYEHTIPKHLPNSISDSVYICQCYLDKAYFATFYDKNRRIPVYSAYVYGAKEETQFENACKNVYVIRQMQLFLRGGWGVAVKRGNVSVENNFAFNTEHGIIIRKCKNEPEYKLKCSQAVDNDYRGNSFFDRGHLNPKGHHSTPESRDATFTLTNAVPQYMNANAKWARQYEEKIKELTEQCTKTFIITSTIPGNTLLNARVNVPEYIWSALCCVDNSGSPMRSSARL